MNNELEGTDYQRYFDEIKELDQTITDLNTIIVNLQLENEELKRQVKYWKDGHDMMKEDKDMYNNIFFNGYI